jgi:hypothetical protein
MNEPQVSPSVPPILSKPTADTPFHIDFGWWKREGLQFDVELRSHLCEEHRAVYSEDVDVETIDWVDMETGEVTQVNGLQHVLQVHCSQQSDYIHPGLSLVNSVLRVFLANGNEPLTAADLEQYVGRPASTILRTLAGRRVYKGIRPVHQGTGRR